MRKNMTILCLLACALCLALAPAQAYAQPYLFDTSGGATGSSGGLGLDRNQSQLAGRLTVPVEDVAWRITSLEAYLFNSGIPETMEVRIYEDSSGTPGKVFASYDFQIPRGFVIDWFGALDLDVIVPPGDYWFGVAYAGDLRGLVAASDGALNPFPLQATFRAGSWVQEDTNIFYRIGGSEVTVPLPEVSYSCAGFDPPMAAGPVTVKGNRTLPLKAQLFDQDGNAITNVDVPPVIKVTYRESPQSPPVDVTSDAFPVGQGTNGNQFVFTGEHWQYNLKTTKFKTPGTYRVTMVSGDRDEYFFFPPCTARFIIK